MELPRSITRGRSRPRSEYKPPAFGFTDVRFFIDKFEAHYEPEKSFAKSVNERGVVKFNPQGESYFGDFPFDESASSGEQVVWRIVFWKLGGILSRCVPSVSFGNFGAFAVTAGLLAPKMITYFLIYPFCRLVFGTLYPAYASYKAVRTKNLKEYVKWMMYWIVFALFTCAETFTDVFLSWFPFYYEIKIVLVLWLLSPATKGSSILYRKFVHPALSRREQEIDDAISKAKEQGYHTVLNLGTKGVNYATAVIMQTAIRDAVTKSHNNSMDPHTHLPSMATSSKRGGGGLVQQLRKSYSLSDLTESEMRCHSDQDMVDEAEDVITDPRLIRRSIARSGYNTRRSTSESNNRSPIYFSEVDMDVRQTRDAGRVGQNISHIKSSEDISSGYSSADNSAALREQTLSRTGSVGATSRSKTRQIATRSSVTTIKRPGAAEGSEVIIEELQDNDNLVYTNLPPLLGLPHTCHISQTNPPFLFEYVGNQIKIIRILGDVTPSFVSSDYIDFPNDIAHNKNSLLENGSPIDPKVDKDNTIEDEISKVLPVCITAETVATEIIHSPDKTFKDDVQVIKETDQKLTKDESQVDNSQMFLIANENKFENISVKEETDKKTSHFIYFSEENKDLQSISSSSSSLNSAKSSNSIDKDDSGEVASMEMSSINDIVETDDEASYGTPEDSPKLKKKHITGGKYGKSKAPAPPEKDCQIKFETNIETVRENFIQEYTTNKMILEPGPSQVNTLKQPVITHGHVSKRKHKQKSKSPARRKSKDGSSPISRLMQLPGRLAFWHKTDDKSKADDWTSSSDEECHRSVTVEKITDNFQSCVNLQEAANIVDDSLKNNIPSITVSDNADIKVEENAPNKLTITDIDLEESAIAKDIQDKSEALQKLIDAKLQSHPEYKIVSLHDDEISTVSKSTEV